jgi:hypothetical protein
VGLEKEEFQTLKMADGKVETKQESFQDWLELDEDPGFQILVFLYFL